MVFGLFKRDGKQAEARRRREAEGPATRNSPPADSGPSTVTRDAPDSVVDAREQARRTVERIDAIEQEMNLAALRQRPVDVRAPRPAAAATAPAADPAAAKARPGQASALPRLEGSHSSVLGGDTLAVDSFEVGGSGVPPVIEEAAILYANRQTAATESILGQAIRNRDQAGPEVGQAWLMLFDLYRMVDNRRDFDKLAVEYRAARHREPPLWSNDPADLPGRVVAPGIVQMPGRIDRKVARNVEAAEREYEKHERVTLDFSRVVTIDADGAQIMLDAVKTFEEYFSFPFRLGRVECLTAAAREHVRPGHPDAASSEVFWLLLLEIHRICGQRDAFEKLSIDYCMAHSVSPLQWQPAAAHVGVAAATPGALEPALVQPPADAFALTGNVEGAIEKLVGELTAQATDRSMLVIDCRELVRLDFGAAGQLLNAVSAMRGRGCAVEFFQPNHLVAALLVVMGALDLARLTPRPH